MKRLLLLAAIAACKIEPGQFDERACATDAECRPDETCVAGLCAQRDCATATECGLGYQYTCDDGCVVQTCTGPSDCATEYECIAGFCGLVCEGADGDRDGICDNVDNCIAIANRDQADTDDDGAGDPCDPDDDGDTVEDGSDPAPRDRFACADADADTCDDCAVSGGPPSVTADGPDADADGQCDASDIDDDGDTVLDGLDGAPTDRFACRDDDVDGCDDCSVTGGPPSATNDGADTDADGACNVGDLDDDNDGIADAIDGAVLDPDVCIDVDTDTCNDCAIGTDNFGPESDADAANDGDDFDVDGLCDLGDPDDDDDGVPDAGDVAPLDNFACRDQDADTCDDCSVTGGPPSTTSDGPDDDGDGQCNAGEPCNQEIAFVAAGAQAAGTAAVVPALPAGLATGDLMIAFVAGRPSDDTLDPATPAGWTRRTGAFANATKLLTYHRVYVVGDVAPTFTPPATWVAGGISASIAAWRGVDPTSPFDTADAAASAAASATFQPAPFATVTKNAWVVSSVATSDDNALDTSLAFVGRMTGVGYDTAVGATGHALGVADKLRVPVGSPPMPLWSQAFSAPDPWVSITFALRPTTGIACTTIAKLVTGAAHACALYTDGTVRCWGDAGFGQLGYGTMTDLGDTEAPNSVGKVSVGGVVADIVAGANHTCVRLTTGRARCWGQNANGQLGLGTTTNIGDDELPSSIAEINVGAPTVVQLAAGDSHTCALLSTGNVKCWGLGSSGQLGYGSSATIGDNEAISTGAFADVGGAVAEVVAGALHTCVRLTAGPVRCFGAGANGRLGYGNTNDIGDDAGEDPANFPALSLGGVAVAQLTAGGAHTCARFTDGTARCWGANASGQLGRASTIDIGDTEAPSTGPVIAFGGTVASIGAGADHTCAILTTGVVRCFGAAGSGQLGYGNLTIIGDNEAPVLDVDLRRAALSLDTSHDHTCALLDSGRARCWGANAAGQLGLATTTTIGDNETPGSASYLAIE